MISGTLASGSTRTQISGKLTGDQIQFSAGNVQYTGRVNGDAISGTTKSGTNNGTWTATRAAK